MKINGVNYNVTLRGHGDPLLLLHGFTGSAANWSAHVNWFSGYFTVITVDLLGHGATDAPTEVERYVIERAAADLRAILTACSVDKPHLLGYSMGGRLALSYALHHPVRSLILESASPGIADDAERLLRRQADEALASQIERDGVERFVDYWQSLPLFATQARLPETTQQQVRQQRLGNRPVGLANSLRGIGTGAQPNYWGRLGGLEPPTLFLCGALDTKYVEIARAMVKPVRRGRVAVVADAGHTIHLEQPNFFRDEVLRFIRDSERRR